MRSSLLVALLCHLVLAGGYWLVTPALEAPREEAYVEAASRCALGGACPDAYSGLLALGLVARGDRDLIAAAIPAHGPGALRVRHGAHEAAGAREHTTLAILRALSILLGAVSVACTHALARRVFPDTGVAAAAALLVACLPQWAASHAVLWHGALLAAAMHVALLVAVRATLRDDPRPSDGLLAGVACAVALATAREGAVVLAPVLLAQAFVLRVHARSAPAWLSLGACVLAAGTGLLASPAPAELAGDGRGVLALARSFLGEFGRGALPQPTLPVLATCAMVALALAGWSLGATRLAVSKRALVLVSLSCSLGTVVGVQAGIREGWLGRSLLVTVGPMMVVTAAGLVAAWRRLAPACMRAPSTTPLFVALPFVPSLLVLTLHVAPAMRLPADLDPHWRTLWRGLRTEPARASGNGVEVRTDTAATLTWEFAPDPAGGKNAPDEPWALIAWDDTFRVLFATHAHDGRLLSARTWSLPPAVAEDLPRSGFWWRAYAVEGPAAHERPWLSPIRWLRVP